MPRAIQLIKQIKRACQTVSDGQINDSQRYLLGLADSALNELIRQDDPSFYLKHIESGVALLQQAKIDLTASGLTVSPIHSPAYEKFHSDLRHDVLAGEIVRIEQEMVATMPLLEKIPESNAHKLATDICSWCTKLMIHRSQKTLPVSAASMITRENLAEYLRHKFSITGSLEVTGFTTLDGGFSKQTILFETNKPVNGHRAMVLRAEQPVSLLSGWDGNDISLEANTIQLVRLAGLPVPEVLWLEEDISHFGNRFIVSSKAPGQKLGEVLGSTEKINDDTLDSVFQLLIKTHAVDVNQARELADTTHLARWLDFETVEECTHHMVTAVLDEMVDKSDIRTTPLMVKGIKWLRKNVPACNESPVLLHQDFALNNMLFDEHGISALLDWETSRLGDPADDLHYFQQNMPEYLSMPELLARYNEVTHRHLDEYRLAYSRVTRCILNIIAFQRSLELLDRNLETNINLCALGLDYAGLLAGHFEGLIDEAEAMLG